MRGNTDPKAPGKKAQPVGKAQSAEPAELFAKRTDLVPTQFLLPKALKAALRERSFHDERSMSDLAREALEQYLKS